MMNPLGQVPFLSEPISRQPNLFKGAYILGWAIFVFYYAIANPFYYWDVIGYVASAYELSGLSGDVLRDSTYNDVRSAVPYPSHFLALTGGTGGIYESTVYQDASSLEQQLSFYRIRYVYVWTTYALGQLIGSFSQATVLISAAAGFLIVLMSGILFWNVKSIIAFLFIPPAVVFDGARTLSRLSTPDAIAALATIFLCALILARRHIAAALLIALLPLFRTDYIIFALATSFILFLHSSSKLAVLSASFALLTYFAANYFAGNYGYVVVFNFTLISGPQPYPLSMQISNDIQDYVEVYIKGFWNLVNQPEIYLYPVITAAIIFFTSAQDRYRNRFFIIYFACLLFAVLHFLLFPAAFPRNYFILTWASLMYLAEAFTLYRHPAQGASKALD